MTLMVSIRRDELDRLHRENREMGEELAEWRRRDRDFELDALGRARLAVCRSRLGLPAGEARGLLFLLDHAGTILTTERLLRVIAASEEVESKIVDVRICRIRRKLREAALDVMIETAWGQGWRLPAADAARLKAYLDGPEGPAPQRRTPDAGRRTPDAGRRTPAWRPLRRRCNNLRTASPRFTSWASCRAACPPAPPPSSSVGRRRPSNTSVET